MGRGRRSKQSWAAGGCPFWGLALAAAVSLLGCGKTAHESAPDEGETGGAPPFPSSPFGGSASTSGGTVGEGEGGSAGNSAVPDSQALVGRPLSPEEASLQPAGCPGALENECEVELGEGRARLATLPTSPSAFDATSEQQLFAVCRTVYVQPRAGCVQPLGVSQSTVRRLAILGDSHVVVQAESIRVLDAKGIVRAAWQSPRAGIWAARVPPVVVSGSVVDFFFDDELLELDPQSGTTRTLALNPSEDVGDFLAVGDDLVWSVGHRVGGCIPHFDPTGVNRYVRESGEIVRESDLPCEALATDGTHIYCASSDHFERWRPGASSEAEPLVGNGAELLFGPGLLSRGSSLYLPEDPTTPVLTLEAPAFLIAGDSAYYELPEPDEQRLSLYRATPQ